MNTREPVFLLRVLTPDGLHLETEASSVVAPGALGYLGILARHAPLVTTLAPGKLTWRASDGAARALHLEAGLLEVIQNRCTVLTRTVSAA